MRGAVGELEASVRRVFHRRWSTRGNDPVGRSIRANQLARIRSYIRALRILRAVESGEKVLVPLRFTQPMRTCTITIPEAADE